LYSKAAKVLLDVVCGHIRLSDCPLAFTAVPRVELHRELQATWTNRWDGSGEGRRNGRPTRVPAETMMMRRSGSRSRRRSRSRSRSRRVVELMRSKSERKEAKESYI
jgi:hypothetical protein